MQMERLAPLWRAGLSEGLGTEEWEKAGLFYPVGGDAASFSQGLIDVERVDIIISLAGLPADLPKWDIYADEEAPLVGAFFIADPDRAAVREWLEKDLVQAVVIKEGNKLRLYTATDLP